MRKPGASAAVAAAMAMAATLLAGCASTPGADDGAAFGPDVTVAAGSSQGAVAGVVFDEAIRPIAGAEVALAGKGRNTTTDDQGQFVFEDLAPGAYFVVANATRYSAIQSSVEVVAGEVVRVRLMLSRLTSIEPYHQTYHFQGFIQASGAISGPIVNIILDEFGDNPFCTCTLEFNTTGQDVRTIVVEAVWEDTLADPRGPTDLYLEVFPTDLDDGTSDIQGGFVFSPVLKHYPIDLWGENETNNDWRARLSGSADHVNYNLSYDLFVTVFVHEAAPENWSLVAQSA